MKKIAVVLASLLIAACATAPKSAPPQTALTGDKAASSTENTTTATVSAAEIESKKLAAEIQKLQQQSVYFDYDKFSVKAEYQDVIQKQAQFIKDHKNDVVTLEGNADERGSNEFNLALGDERAKAVKKELEMLGVPSTQIKVISLGDEKPRLSCHEEKCWKENRRDDFVHKFN